MPDGRNFFVATSNLCSNPKWFRDESWEIVTHTLSSLSTCTSLPPVHGCLLSGIVYSVNVAVLGSNTPRYGALWSAYQTRPFESTSLSCAWVSPRGMSHCVTIT